MASDDGLCAAAALLRDAGWAVLEPDVVAELHDLISRAEGWPDRGHARVVGYLQAHIGDGLRPTRED